MYGDIATEENGKAYVSQLAGILRLWRNQSNICSPPPTGSNHLPVCYTPDGFAFLSGWGSARFEVMI